ncbi:hypothetical protein KZO01_02620 [Kurthia zopfii]|nr:hypothetical protein KZO01_02620 [Kurthia zopfii]
MSPKISTNAAMKGPDKPYKNNPTAKASEIFALLHENSASKGSIKTPEDDRTIPATMMDINVMIKMTQL